METGRLTHETLPPSSQGAGECSSSTASETQSHEASTASALTHFIGLGGIGMSALAHILLDEGQRVSGSDLQVTTPILEQLVQRGATCAEGHHVEHLPQDATCVVLSSMVRPDNMELQAARARGLPILHRSDLLANLMQEREPLLVTGTHGKTTTSALLSWVLTILGWDASYAIGGLWQQQARVTDHRHGYRGRGLYFVAEADESDGTFLRYPARGAILTNCEADHLDHFGSMEALTKAFHRFASQVPRQHLIWCCDDQNFVSMGLLGPSYGYHERADYRLVETSPTSWGMHLRLREPGGVEADYVVPLLGRHNALNAAAVATLLRTLGLSAQEIAEGMKSFPGVRRRCEKTLDQPLVLTDYAHHPTEIAVTLSAIRTAIGSRRLVVAFQPHRYSRTQQLMEEFAGCFQEADELVLTEIYGACEAPIPGVSAEVLSEKLHQRHRDHHIEPRNRLVESLQRLLKPDDVLVCMGAGDIDAVAHEVAEQRRHGRSSS